MPVGSLCHVSPSTRPYPHSVEYSIFEMSITRTIRVILRRAPSRDREDGPAPVEGYDILWPDGRPLGVGFDAFCKHGQRLFGLGRHLNGRAERLVELTCHPLDGLESPLTRQPGQRVRRFYLLREGQQGRLHFLDGTPTAIVFDLGRDEQAVLDWVGLPGLAEGEAGWMDLAARPEEA